MRLHPLALFSLSILLLPAGFVSLGSAQEKQQDKWREATQARLKQIYDQNLFRPQATQTEWSEDGTSFRVLEKSTGSARPQWKWYEASTGKAIPKAETSSQVTETEHAADTRSDHSWSFNTRNQKLVIQRQVEGKTEAQFEVPGGKDIRFYGMTWSPDHRHLAFIQSDQTHIRKRAMLVPTDPSYPGIRESHFARVGEKIATLRVGVVDVKSQSVTWIPLNPVTSNGQQGFYLGQVEWAGNSEELLIEKLSRFRDQRQFLIARPATGELKEIFNEVNPAWAISSQGKNLGLIWINDGQQFIVISEKDGWRHAFLYTREGKELRTLTPGDYDIIERGPVDEVSGCFYFYASPENGTQKQLHRVRLDGQGKLERITPESLGGTHHYRFSPKLDFAIHTHSTIDSPPVVSLISLPNHKTIKVLQDNQAIGSLLKNWNVAATEFVNIETQPDVAMDALIMKPRDFDPEKKYPVLIYVYGEPHGQTVLDEWSAGQSLFHRVITDLGYIVVSIDNRGTPAPKGAAWRRSIFGSLGPLSTEDQADAIEQLAIMKPYIDLNRLAIWGWSGGGSNTLNALFRKPDLYQVGIAVVPKPQPHLYNAWFQEIYMRTREVNAEGYRQSAPLHFAEGLRGKLLMVTGSGETNTHIQIIEGLVDRLIEMGKPFDYMVYPNRNHGLSEGPGSRVHVRMLIARYLIENLPNEPR